VFEPQAHLSLETALRLSPEIALGLYGDVGAGDPAPQVRDQCESLGRTCIATSGRIGPMLRFTFGAARPTSTWLSVGTGWEFGRVEDRHGDHFELLRYTGREHLRVGAGVDFRSSRTLGVGLYAAVGLGAYSQLRDSTGTTQLDEVLHTNVQLGLRFVLFP
jgi:hypothetical protein